MLNEKKLSKADKLIYKLYTRNNIDNKADYILENGSIIEDRIGTRLTVEEPIIEWTKKGKEEKIIKRVFIISKDGNINKDYEKKEDKIDSINSFIDKTSYTLEKCTENLIRMTKVESSISYRLNNHSLEKEKTITPSIIYLNNQGQVLDIITLEKKSIKQTKYLY